MENLHNPESLRACRSSRFLTTSSLIALVKLNTNQLRHRGGTYALDNIRDFAGSVAAGSG